MERKTVDLEVYEKDNNLIKLNANKIPDLVGVSLLPLDMDDESITVCEFTSLEDEGVKEIIFSPPHGIMVSNIRVISNNTIEFDLKIAAETPLGDKTVTVIYDDGNKSVTGVNLFEVQPPDATDPGGGTIRVIPITGIPGDIYDDQIKPPDSRLP